MSLWLIPPVALGLAVMWRLARLAVRLGLLLMLTALVAVYGASWSPSQSSPTAALPARTSARVAHAADGDTSTAITASGPVRVRRLGIDTPELTSTRLGYPTCGGRATESSTPPVDSTSRRVASTIGAP